MNIKVRMATLADNEGVLSLLEQIAAHHHKGRPDIFKSGVKKYSYQDLEEILSDPMKPIFVAVDEESRVLGYVFCVIINYRGHSVFQDSDVLYIDDFCVDEQLRGQNIGKILFDEIKRYAISEKFNSIELNVWEFNEGAIRFYEKHGMKVQRRRMELLLEE